MPVLTYLRLKAPDLGSALVKCCSSTRRLLSSRPVKMLLRGPNFELYLLFSLLFFLLLEVGGFLKCSISREILPTSLLYDYLIFLSLAYGGAILIRFYRLLGGPRAELDISVKFIDSF